VREEQADCYVRKAGIQVAKCQQYVMWKWGEPQGVTEPQVGIQDESFITARPGHFEMQGQ
jgi:hypothetical protein